MFLMYSAIGDAYGAAFEFFPNTPFKNDLKEFHKNPHGHGFTPAGWFTDDTEMSLAVAQTITENDVASLTPKHFVENFIKMFQTERRPGYASGFYNFLCGIENADQFLNTIHNNSDRNGAAMRSGPLGFLNLQDSLRIAEMQASITHKTIDGILSSQIITLLYYHTLNKGLKKDAIPFLISNLNHYHRDNAEYLNKIKTIRPLEGPTSINGFDASLAVLDTYLTGFSASHMLKYSIDRGGDTDTLASLAMGLAFLSDQITNDLPNELIVSFNQKEPQINKIRDANFALWVRHKANLCEKDMQR